VCKNLGYQKLSSSNYAPHGAFQDEHCYWKAFLRVLQVQSGLRGLVLSMSAHARQQPPGERMNSKQSSSKQFMLYLKSLGGSEADLTGPACVVSDEDTVETVVSRLRMEKYARGCKLVDPSILHTCAQVLISRRDESSAGHSIPPQRP
jgi:hypothetical protein